MKIEGVTEKVMWEINGSGRRWRDDSNIVQSRGGGALKRRGIKREEGKESIDCQSCGVRD